MVVGMCALCDVVLVLARQAGENLLFAARIFFEQAGEGHPDDAHAGATAGFDAGNGVFEDDAFLRLDLRLVAAGALKVLVDGLERKEVDIWRGFAAAGRDAGIIAEDGALAGEIREDVL